MYQAYKWNLAKTVTCPLCSTQKDDHNHFLQCPNIDIHRINETGMKSINNKMYAMKTTPALQKTLNYLLRNWHKTPENDKEWIASLDKDLQRCVLYQSIIGRDNFIRGIFYHRWRYYQHKECKITHKEYNEDHIRWISKIIEAVVTYGRDKWNERCKIVKAGNTATHEHRQRQAALELCKTYRFNLSTIHPKHHCLFRKTKHYFKRATIENILQSGRKT